MSAQKSDSENNEMKVLIHEKQIAFTKHDVKNDFKSPPDKESKPSCQAEEHENFINKNGFDFEKSEDINVEVNVWSKKKITNKSLLTFRLTMFLWYGAGCLPGLFLGIFLKQRGLTLIELSSVYSLIFIFQLITSFVTGIITDKIGNAKPVLIFLMLSTSSVLIFINLTPNLYSVSCTKMETNLNLTNVLKSRQNFSACFISCLLQKNKTPTQENCTGITVMENISLFEEIDLVAGYNKTSSDISTITFNNNSFKLSIDDCCDVCENSWKTENCVKTRKSYLVIIYAVLILAFFSLWNTAYRFLDFSAVSLAAKEDSHYGKERTFAICGPFLATIIVALILNTNKTSESKMNYNVVIWIAAGLQLCAFLTICMTKVPILPPGKKLMKKAFGLLKDINILAFILLVFVAGNGFSFSFTLHLVFLETINAPSIVVSLHTVAIYFYGFAVSLTSEWWLKKFGANNLFVLCILCYTVNYAAYSFIVNAWWSLLIDITYAVTFHLFWIAVVVHCRNVAPVGFAATLNALTGTAHYGIGRSSGVLFGGRLMNYVGPRKSYRIMAAILFAMAVSYSIFIFIRRKSLSVNGTVNDDETTDSKSCKKTEIPDA